MFLGRFHIVVSGNILRIPPELAQLLDGRGLRFEPVHGPDGAVVMGLPHAGESEAALDPHGGLHLSNELLRHAGITDSAVIEGRGAYLVIRA